MEEDQGPELQDALRYASDADRLLDGENPATTYLEDAVMWEESYRELSDYKKSLIERSRAAEKAVSHAGIREIRTDLVILEAEHSRLQRRLAFWRHRRGELESGAVRASRAEDGN